MLMKTLFMALFGLMMVSAACKKNETAGIDPVENSPADSPSSGGKIPAELVGKWSYGTFSPTNFWNYNGTYAGNAYEQALVFEFHADGTYEEYVINSTTSYNCRTEAYTYFKGKVTVNAANQSFVITPTSGRYRGFYACAPKSNIDRAAKSNELKQEQMNYQVEAGKTGIKLSDAEAPQGVRLKAITW
ncbi:hypothetical protein GCM10027341_40760 [Spirosoma knui]